MSLSNAPFKQGWVLLFSLLAQVEESRGILFELGAVWGSLVQSSGMFEIFDM